ncbi:MAG: hypothetical protein QM808_00560 [Steroidobacteraceae bacterium]
MTVLASGGRFDALETELLLLLDVELLLASLLLDTALLVLLLLDELRLLLELTLLDISLLFDAELLLDAVLLLVGGVDESSPSSPPQLINGRAISNVSKPRPIHVCRRVASLIVGECFLATLV